MYKAGRYQQSHSIGVAGQAVCEVNVVRRSPANGGVSRTRSAGEVIARTREVLMSAVVGAEHSTALKATCPGCTTIGGVGTCAHEAGK